jgi:uncharacterized protein YaiI (UPF0178 family)
MTKCNKILVDADACPKQIKDILYRAVDRVKIAMILVANQPLTIPKSKLISSVQVGAGFDVADKYIIEIAAPGDLIITADIPLADSVVTKGAYALNPRGELYDASNIKEKLGIRNFMGDLRSTGQFNIGGPAPLNHRDNQKFANALDSFLRSLS